MENYIAIGIILVVVFLAALYVYREKKKGKKCIGCPYSSSCGRKDETPCQKENQ